MLPKDLTEVGHSQKSADGWVEATSLLVRTYKRQKASRVDMDVLFDAFSDIDGQLILEAAKRHILDTTDDYNDQPAGRWFPTPADVRKQLNLLDQEERRSIANKTSSRVEFAGATRRLVPVPEEIRPYFQGRSEVEVWASPPNACSMCGNSGEVYYYVYPPDDRQVYMGEEWLMMYDDDPQRANLFRAYKAICLCPHGSLRWEEQSHKSYGLPHIRRILPKVQERIKRTKEAHDEHEVTTSGGPNDD